MITKVCLLINMNKIEIKINQIKDIWNIIIEWVNISKSNKKTIKEYLILCIKFFKIRKKYK